VSDDIVERLRSLEYLCISTSDRKTFADAVATITSLRAEVAAHVDIKVAMQKELNAKDERIALLTQERDEYAQALAEREVSRKRWERLAESQAKELVFLTQERDALRERLRGSGSHTDEDGCVHEVPPLPAITERSSEFPRRGPDPWTGAITEELK
jgi:hypothetical protein